MFCAYAGGDMQDYLIIKWLRQWQIYKYSLTSRTSHFQLSIEPPSIGALTSHAWIQNHAFQIQNQLAFNIIFLFRIHEEKKKRISFPMSNPRFQEPNSAVEKIKTPGPAKWVAELNSDLLRRKKTTGMWLTSFTNCRKRKLKFQLNAGQLRRIALKIFYSFRIPPTEMKMY